MLNFPGVGRVIERSDPVEPEGPLGQEPKHLDSPTAHSALSTGRDLSGRCLSDETHVSPGRVSPDEAHLICQSVLSDLLRAETGAANVAGSIVRLPGRAEVAETPREQGLATPKDPTFNVDLASVKVTKSDRGCVCGVLDWLGGVQASKGPEKVAFTLLEIRQGYTVVGETVEGPKLLSSLCWKLQSINGLADARPAWIRRGDILMLEGARWATKRLFKPLPPVPTKSPLFASQGLETTQKLPATAPASAPPIGATSARSGRSESACPLPDEDDELPPLLMDSTPPQVAKPSRTRALAQASSLQPAVPKATPLTRSLSIDFEVVQISAKGTADAAPCYTPSVTDCQEKTFSEVSSTSGSQLDRPMIPVLDLKSVNLRRENRLANQAQPAQSNGCDFGWVECNMVPPKKNCQGKKEAQGWKCI